MTSLSLSIAVIWLALFFLVAGPVHECAHAFAALRLGDRTAKLFGRVTLDPIAHFDPVGGGLLALSVMFGAFSGSGIGFGWAKPTPVNPLNLRGRYGDAIVAAAGPLSNLALAAAFAIGFRVCWANHWFPDNTSITSLISLVMLEGVELNVILMLFNLLPVAPLDGSHVLQSLMDPRTARQYAAFMDQYGLMVLVLIVLVAGRLITPVLVPIVNALVGVQILI